MCLVKHSKFKKGFSVYKDLIEQENQLRKEADVILYEKKIKSILENYGKVQVQGSYYLQLMTWRDLDFYVQNDEISINDCFDLAKELATVLNPFKLSYKNNVLQSVRNEPDGVYFGLKTKIIEDFIWKLDVWIFDTKQFYEKFNICEHILSLLNPGNRRIILEIKNELCHHPEYRDGITSFDIYNAVLKESVKDINQFWDYQKAAEMAKNA